MASCKVQESKRTIMIWYQVVNIAFCIVLHGVCMQKINRMSCRNEATFKAKHNGFALIAGSSKLTTTRRAVELSLCARSCITSSVCKSVVYKKTTKASTEVNCQLLNAEKSELNSSDLQDVAGWTYYEPLKQGTSRCQPSTCSSGEKCIDDCSTVTGYKCIADVSACQSNPCRFGGDCIDGINSYSCDCKLGYSGEQCEKAPPGFTFGDGTGGSEHMIGTTKNREECIALCQNSVRQGVKANGITMDSATQTRCYCEYGQTGATSSTSWINKFL